MNRLDTLRTLLALKAESVLDLGEVPCSRLLATYRGRFQRVSRFPDDYSRVLSMEIQALIDKLQAYPGSTSVCVAQVTHPLEVDDLVYFVCEPVAKVLGVLHVKSQNAD